MMIFLNLGQSLGGVDKYEVLEKYFKYESSVMCRKNNRLLLKNEKSIMSNANRWW